MSAPLPHHEQQHAYRLGQHGHSYIGPAEEAWRLGRLEHRQHGRRQREGEQARAGPGAWWLIPRWLYTRLRKPSWPRLAWRG